MSTLFPRDSQRGVPLLSGGLWFVVLFGSLFGVQQLLAQGTLPVSFIAHIDSPLPAAPSTVSTTLVADFNGDGKMDVAVSDNSSVWVLLGNGDGTFQPAATYTVTGATFFALGDFNGDGKPDILAVAGSTVSVLLNNGDGTFGAPIPTTINTNAPGVIAIGDFNGDGKADISVPAPAPQNGLSAVSILLGNGDGTFQSPINSSDYVSTPLFAQVADFNGDGKLDVLWENEGNIDVFLGNGNGTVQNALTVGASDLLAIGDFNGDGIPDLVSSTFADHEFEALISLGKGDGTFSAPVLIFSMPQPSGFVGALTGDFNNDGKMDLLIFVQAALPVVGNPYVLLGNGDGTFQTPIVPANISVGEGGGAIGDFNGDGIPDLASTVVTLFSLNPLAVVSVVLGQGNGDFLSDAALIPCSTGLCTPTQTVIVGDLNGDGYMDFFFLQSPGSDSEEVGTVVLANPGGTYRALPAFEIGTSNQYVSGTLADFNKDGKLDAAVTAGSAMGILLGNGDGTFAREVTYGDTTPAFVAVGDFHGTGNVDVVTADTSGDTVSLFPGNGDGTFGFATSFPAGSSLAGSLVVGDFNGDGKLDLALANGNVLFGNGNGTFGSPVSSYPAGGSIQTADFNNDGIPDLALTTSTGVEVMLGNGDGTFGLPVNFTLTFAPGAITVSDFNHDGKMDIAVGAGAANLSDVLILLGNGDGTFQLAPGYFEADNYSNLDNLAAVDVNGDGYPDIVTGSGALLLNRPIGAVATVLPSTLNFGNLGVGNKQTDDVTFFNISQATVTISSVKVSGANAGDFSANNGCGSSVESGAQCVIGVTFTPGAEGARSATLTITDSDAGSPHVVALTGDGTGLGLVLASGSSGSATVSAGQTAKYVLSIGGTEFNGTAKLSCTGAPTDATCSVPSSVQVNGTKATQFNVSVSTTAPTSGLIVPRRFTPSPWLWAAAIVGMLILPQSDQGRRALRRLTFALPFGVILVLCSCGGGGGSTGPGANGGTPAGSSTLTVTATSGTLQETLELKLVVQ